MLIVEDEENERTGLAELVSGWGYRTDTAFDGVDALEKIPIFAPSIVITESSEATLGTGSGADALLLSDWLLAWFAWTSVHISPKASEGSRIQTKQRFCICCKPLGRRTEFKNPNIRRSRQ